MTDVETLFIIPLSFIGFVLKAIASFGPGIVMVPVGALIFGAREMVLLSGCLDFISNISLFRPQKTHFKNPFWLSMLVSMIIGTMLGASLLSLLPVAYFELILGVLLIPVGLWTIHNRKRVTQSSDLQYPQSVKHSDLLVTFLSGCMSGLSGITAPVLAWYFHRQYNRRIYREIMIPLLLASALIRVIVYALSGALSTEILPLLMLALPGLVVGLWIGNRIYLKISQYWLSIIIGSLVSLSGIKLLYA